MSDSSSEEEEEGIAQVDRREFYQKLGWDEPGYVPTSFKMSQQQLINLYYVVHQVRFLAVGQNKVYGGVHMTAIDEMLENMVEIEVAMLSRRTARGSATFGQESGVKKMVTQDEGFSKPKYLEDDEEDSRRQRVLKGTKEDGVSKQVTFEEEKDDDGEDGSCVVH